MGTCRSYTRGSLVYVYDAMGTLGVNPRSLRPVRRTSAPPEAPPTLLVATMSAVRSVLHNRPARRRTEVGGRGRGSTPNGFLVKERTQGPTQTHH